MTMELLAVPASLAHNSGLCLCTKCVGGVMPDRYEPVERSDRLERVVGSPCEMCGGTGVDPAVAS